MPLAANARASVAHVPRFALVELVEDVCLGVRRVVLDVRGLGIHCEPGDRCAILAENDPELVQRTLDVLRASGDEPRRPDAGVDDGPRAASGRRREPPTPIRDVLAFGHIRPVARDTAKALYGMTLDESLRDILEARTEDQWELYDLLGASSSRAASPRSASAGPSAATTRTSAAWFPRWSRACTSVSSIAGDGFAADRMS